MEVAGNTPPVSPPQGNDGGQCSGSRGGGGGGASCCWSRYSKSRTTAGKANGGCGTTNFDKWISNSTDAGGGGASSVQCSPEDGGSGLEAVVELVATPGNGNGGDGTANTGGGGGGGGISLQVHGKQGGSGIVIIRYKFQ